jgi:hypothetical protein
MGVVLGSRIGEGRRRPVSLLLLLAVAGAATLLILPASALAQTSDDPSAVDQYVEDVPTDEGTTIPGTKKPKKKKLPAAVSNEIATQGGSDSELLTQVASSSDYGAPQRTIKRKAKAATISGAGMERRETENGQADAQEDVSAASALSAGLGADGGEAGRLVGLLVVLLLISLGAFAISGMRYRRRSE